MITVTDLSYQYSPASVMSFPDFTVQPGEHILLLGESGSGKTTLLYLLAGMLRNYSGSILIKNAFLERLSESEMDKFRGQNFGFVFQRNHLMSALTVKQNLMMPAYLAGLPVNQHRISEVMKSLGISDFQERKVSQLSQGQAQRVAIARAVIIKPSIILADEPTSALDDKHCSSVMLLLQNVARQNNAILIVATHDQRLKNSVQRQLVLTSDFQVIRD